MINILEIFIEIEFTKYLMSALGFYGVMLCLRRLILNK